MIAIVDYNAGNLASVARAVAHLGFACTVTADAGAIRAAERIIFPGVGAAGAAMDSLKRAGLDVVLVEQFAAGKPMLGICLGTQVIMGYSEDKRHALPRNRRRPGHRISGAAPRIPSCFTRKGRGHGR